MSISLFVGAWRALASASGLSAGGRWEAVRDGTSQSAIMTEVTDPAFCRSPGDAIAAPEPLSYVATYGLQGCQEGHYLSPLSRGIYGSWISMEGQLMLWQVEDLFHFVAIHEA
jgi:hypothetical protein